MSSSGRYIIVGTTKYLHGSKDYGNTWSKIDDKEFNWTSVSISDDGGIFSSAVGVVIVTTIRLKILKFIYLTCQ